MKLYVIRRICVHEYEYKNECEYIGICSHRESCPALLMRRSYKFTTNVGCKRSTCITTVRINVINT